jgi:hypothetical protein
LNAIYRRIVGQFRRWIERIAFGDVHFIHPLTTPARKDEIRRQLLQYCKLDTYALVRLWEHFSGRNDWVSLDAN